MKHLNDFQKKENQRALKELDEKDQISVRKVMSGLSIFKVNSYDAEIIKQELIGMAQEYRLRGESFDDAIGCDLKSFTEGVLASSNGRSIVEIILRYVAYTSLYFGTAIVVASGLLYSNWIWVDIPQLLFFVWLIASSVGFLAAHILKPQFCFETGWRANIPELVGFLIFLAGLFLAKSLNIGQDTMTADMRYIAVISYLCYFGATYANHMNSRRFHKQKATA